MTDEANVSKSRFDGLMGTMNARTRERDEAIAENERLRAELATYTQHDPNDIYAAPTAPTPPSEPPESGADDDAQVEVKVVSDPVYAAMQQRSPLVDSDGRMMVPASVARQWSAGNEPVDDLERARANFNREAAEYMEYLKSQS